MFTQRLILRRLSEQVSAALIKKKTAHEFYLFIDSKFKSYTTILNI